VLCSKSVVNAFFFGTALNKVQIVFRVLECSRPLGVLAIELEAGRVSLDAFGRFNTGR